MDCIVFHPTVTHQPLISDPVHCSRENIELVLQETCVEYQSPLSATVSPFELPAGSGPVPGYDRKATVPVQSAAGAPLMTNY